MGIATTSTITPATRQLSDQNPLGTVLGASPTDLIGFYGVNPGVPQNTTAISISTGTAAQIITQLGLLGLIKTTT